MIITQLACPKCKGIMFEVISVTYKNFFWGNGSLIDVVERCVNCGWLSNPTDEEEIKRRMQMTLRKEEPDWEGYINIPENIQTIKDTFEIKIGNTSIYPKENEVGNFICKTKRLGAKFKEPFDAHQIEEWIVQELKLIGHKNYKVQVIVTCNKTENGDKK